MRGFVHGKTIELEDTTGLPEGQEVLVTVCPVNCDKQTQATNEALKRAFGGWGNDAAGLDEFLDWNRQQRKVSRAEPTQ